MNKQEIQYDNLDRTRNGINSFQQGIQNIPNIDDDFDIDGDYEVCDYDYGEDKAMTKINGYDQENEEDELAETNISDLHLKEAETLQRKLTGTRQKENESLHSAGSFEGANPAVAVVNDEEKNNLKKSRSSKSQFYVSQDELGPELEPEPVQILQSADLVEYSFEKLYENETVKDSLTSVTCLCSCKDHMSVDIKGKLMLTPFQLVYIPYTNQIDSKIALIDENTLCLFGNRMQPFSFAIPLTFIYEIKTLSDKSEKYRRIVNVLENTPNGIPKDMLIKCKNFMTKLFTFSNPSKNHEKIYSFIKNLIILSNNQRVKSERFNQLILSVISEINNKENESEKKNLEKPQHTTQNQRKSYMLSSHIHQDLNDSNCDKFMQIKSGTVNISTGQGNFAIKTNMPFFAAPKNVVDIILRKRIVLNESNMTELNPDLSSSPSPVGNTLTHIRKPSLVTGLLLASPKNKLTTSPSTANLNQAINLTSVSHSNPFYENNFPLWSFTDTATGCSLIIVPECSHSNKQDECDTIIKNYNALLCDEINKSKKLQAQNLVQIQLHLYAEYEFYKFKVPFDHQKISSSYLKLMEICSYKSIAEYNKENESNSFYLRLHNSKWLKRVSELLQLATKIINCLRFNERNVFLEEFKGSTDCSCILSSLAKICMNRICRTVSGFEDLIQKEWFLVGHMFSKRLETCLVSNSDEFINEAEKARSNSAIDSSVVQANSSSSKSNGQISPTFLLFLDCVFQLIIQYPEEFEFNEIYLIHMWDYSCSGASLGFSFDGVVSWQNYLDSQTFMISSNTPVDSESRTEFSKKLFQANNSFWLSHIQKNRDILFNTKNYEPKSLILTPNDKMYALKFWSRCYLRFCEKFHCYNNEETTINKEHSPLKKLEPTTSNTLLSQRPAPPPPSAKPPTPKLKHLPDQSIKKSPSKSNFNVTISSSGLKITTKVTEDGHITTSF